MLKKKCLAALSGILLAITVIAPFSFTKVEAESPAIATLTYAYATDVNVSDVGSGSPFYLYKPRLIYITINMPEESTGIISITTTNYSSNSNVNRLNWDTNCIQVFGAQITKVSTTQYQLNFQHTKQIYIIVGNDTGGSNLPTWYQDVSSWSINGTIDVSPYDEIIANQELIESNISQLLNEFLSYSENIGIYSNKHLWNFACSQGVNAGYNLITVPTENVGQNLWIKLADNGTYFSKNYIYHFFMPFQYRSTDNIYYPDLSDGLWTFNETSKSTRVHYKEGLTNDFKYKIFNDVNGFHLYIWDLYTVQNVNEVLLAHFNFNSSIRYLATNGYWESMELNSYLGGMFYTNINNMYYLERLVSGNSSSNTVINNNDQQNSSGETVINQYDQLTSTFESDFDDSQTEMVTILHNTNLTQFSDAAIWFTQQLGFLYNSLGDMKILVAMPLILGIALFFIGRGNVVFRSPNTTNDNFTETQVFNEDGSLRDSFYTHQNSKTTRSRGRW